MPKVTGLSGNERVLRARHRKTGLIFAFKELSDQWERQADTYNEQRA